MEQLNNVASVYIDTLNKILITKFEPIRIKHNLPEITNIKYEVAGGNSLLKFIRLIITTSTGKQISFQKMDIDESSNGGYFNLYDDWYDGCKNLIVGKTDKECYDNNYISKSILQGNESKAYIELYKDEIEAKKAHFKNYVETGIYLTDDDRKIFLLDLENYLMDVRKFLMQLKLT